MIVIGWAAFALALITLYALGLTTENDLTTTLLAVFFAAQFVIMCWAFGRRPQRKAPAMATKALPLTVTRHVLWHFGDTNLGQEPGHFVSRLLVLASSADEENLEKLRSQWPSYIDAWESVARKPWGLEWLRGIAKAEMDREELGLDFGELSA